MVVLVFPGGMAESLAFNEQARLEGLSVIGASSLTLDPAAASYAEWKTLPYIHDKSFEAALASIIARRNITRIFCPHRIICRYLRKVLPALAPHVELLGALKTPNTLFHLDLESLKDYRRVSEWDFQHTVNRQPLSDNELSALLEQTFKIPGESHLVKLIVLCAVALWTPKGDVVEVGVLQGRSAFLLGWLGQHYQIGKLLCIDAWDKRIARQSEAPPIVNEVLEHEIEIDECFLDFVSNLVPRLGANTNYYRGTSEAANCHYRSGRSFSSSAFGITEFLGRPALIHVDANHDYDSVKNDIALWAPMIVPGGWLIIDDYQWPWGDGPKRAGDELLTACIAEVDTAFVAGGALFVRRAPESNGPWVQGQPGGRPGSSSYPS